jgi:hypothetical protein
MKEMDAAAFLVHTGGHWHLVFRRWFRVRGRDWRHALPVAIPTA